MDEDVFIFLFSFFFHLLLDLAFRTLELSIFHISRLGYTKTYVHNNLLSVPIVSHFRETMTH